MKKFLVLSVLFIASKSQAVMGYSPAPVLVPNSVVSSSASAVGGQAQVTITTPTNVGPYSSGYYNYLTNIHIEMFAAATLAVANGPLSCTTVGIGNTPSLGFSTVVASGTVVATDLQFANPLQANQASNVVVTCPATANVRWNVVVGYYQGS